MSLAQRVRDYRYSKGWGPDELATRADISRTALYQIESGKTELPRAATLRRIALALEVPMESLLGHAMADVDLRQPAVIARAAERPRAAGERPSADERGRHPRPPFENHTIEDADGTVFAVKSEDHSRARVHPSEQDRELTAKLHVLLESPLGDGVVRIIDELYRTLPRLSTSS
jgi:transcriptional regulator with XRE-family HTH domain